MGVQGWRRVGMGWVGGREKGLLPVQERFVNANLLIYPPTDNNGVDLIYIGTQIDTQTHENNPILLLYFLGGIFCHVPSDSSSGLFRLCCLLSLLRCQRS